MTKRAKITIKIENGQCANIEEIVEWLKEKTDGIYEVSAKKIYKDRTLLQNRYYWAICVGILSTELGYFPEEVHEVLKDKFLTLEYKLKGGKKTLKRVRSTTELTTVEFMAYIEQIREFFRYKEDCGEKKIWIDIPPPSSDDAEMERIIKYYENQYH